MYYMFRFIRTLSVVHMDAITNFITAYPVAVAFGAFVGMIFAWAILQQFIRPMLIPKTEINNMADELFQKHGPEAEYHAHIEEDRAWRYSDTYEQGKWRRVRRELWRRYRAGEWE